ADSAIHAEIDASSFRTGNEQRDQSVLSARFLDATRYPVISFRDGLVSADGTTIRGTLTVREVARPVSLSIGQVTADERSFTAGYGEIVALLGPNGAGKTATLEILEGFRTRDGGTAEVLSYDPGERSSSRELRERTGLVLQDIAVEPYLTVRETIARAAGYYR